MILCLLHEANADLPSVEALTVVLGMAVCEDHATAIISNIQAGESFTAADYIKDES